MQQSWDILSRSQSSQIQISNGSFNRSVVYTLILMPKKQGTVMIPAVCFGSNCTFPLPIEVSASLGAGNATNTPLLLEAEVNPQKIVIQGQLLLKVRLLRRVDLLEGQVGDPQPIGIETVVKKLGDDRSYETRRNGQRYQVIERDYAIFPQESGILQIPALQFDGTIADGSSRFDPFGRQGRRVRETSKPLQVKVLPLPAELGSRPWIPATALKLQDDWQQQVPHLVVGEPVTRTLRLSADGVPAAQLPELKLILPDSFKSYPDQPNREDQLSNNGIKGVLKQKIALVPTHPGRYQLPAIDLDWWNIMTGQWQHAHLAALTIDVAATTSSIVTNPPVVPASTSKTSVKSEPQPAQTLPPVGRISAPNAGFWPWLSLGLALGWLLTLVLLRLRRHPSIVAKIETKDAQPDEKSARRAVIQAAENHDPQATRQTLVQWSRIIWPNVQGGGYEQLCKTADPALRQELGILDLSLYGNSKQVWNGQNLANKIAVWQSKKTTSASSVLPDLYP